MLDVWWGICERQVGSRDGTCAAVVRPQAKPAWLALSLDRARVHQLTIFNAALQSILWDPATEWNK